MTKGHAGLDFGIERDQQVCGRDCNSNAFRDKADKSRSTPVVMRVEEIGADPT